MKSSQSILFGVLLMLVYCRGFYASVRDRKDLCPKINPWVFLGYRPLSKEDAGLYMKISNVTLNGCIMKCCESDNCNVVFMNKNDCYTLSCKTNDDCLPVYAKEHVLDFKMILVAPLSPANYWTDILEGNSFSEPEDAKVVYSLDKICEVNNDCSDNELCDPQIGICVCSEGYQLDDTKKFCYSNTGNLGLGSNISGYDVDDVNNAIPEQQQPFDSLKKVSVESESQKPPEIKHLVVSVLSKTVRLPENEATLSAYTVPADDTGHSYQYEWSLISKTQGSGQTVSMNDQNGSTLKLSNLVEGLYMFKVTVTGTGAFGEAQANVTVLLPQRINTPPKAVILPSSLVVKLPNTVAVLDGSSSRDDTGIVHWRWELQKGQLGYRPHLPPDTPTLQLNDLQIPGNYTFKLTVMDAWNATDSTTANITVMRVPDYPPEANAGQDMVVYLPVKNVTLNGSLSTDDHGIVAWEWTKSSSDQNKAVDIQDTRTPYPRLSNLEEGLYTFVLRVTDNANQTSSPSEVHVFVKPPTNKPPVAVAGKNLTLSLPQTWALLDGSKSSDDIGIEKWKWYQISGPSNVRFNKDNASRTNVTELTKGVYVIGLTVTDGNGNNASDIVKITVYQNKNTPPKANAGGDKTIVLPVSAIVLNGSLSWDDLAIVKWDWIREPNSLAAGNIILNSDHSSVLIVTNIVEGRYVFRLKVTDDQGASSEDIVSVNVKPDPIAKSIVCLTLYIEASRLTQNQADEVKLKLGMLLPTGSQLKVRKWTEEQNSKRAQLHFFVDDNKNKTLSGPDVVSMLKSKLKQDSSLLQLSVDNIQTTVCQNNCSGHGICEEETRICVCEAFWMHNLYRALFGDGESNCEWSIVYVVIILAALFVTTVFCFWSIACFCNRICTTKQKIKKYKLVGVDDDNHSMKSSMSHLELSDTDSDSDVLLDVRKAKMNQNSMSNKFLNVSRYKKNKRVNA
ncbi:dyslexia-associated protein KIAA0319-like protein isoform X1 [Rhopalosiphum maidis]|uniref:dyslexia-associated protein KIAA0319-like protein isoform X1 n=2 Tax=Rhopalosiphum maidis TaxID=43146 RepID=UPI000EFE46D7|nr:dyslexia-associated protein KIAA0319-like protein isoform X1 [Rhopalosiphum maidis]